MGANLAVHRHTLGQFCLTLKMEFCSSSPFLSINHQTINYIWQHFIDCNVLLIKSVVHKETPIWGLDQKHRACSLYGTDTRITIRLQNLCVFGVLQPREKYHNGFSLYKPLFSWLEMYMVIKMHQIIICFPIFIIFESSKIKIKTIAAKSKSFS